MVSRKPTNLVYGSGIRFSFLLIIYTYKSIHASNLPPQIQQLQI